MANGDNGCGCSGDKVVDVALALGCDSPGALASMFRKHLGESPSDFSAEAQAKNTRRGQFEWVGCAVAHR